MRNRKRKGYQKKVALLLSVITGISMIGCNQETDESEKGNEVQQEGQAEDGTQVLNEGWFPIMDEAITITVAGQNTSTPDWNDTDMVEWFETEMGVIMECDQYESDAWATQFALMLTSDELPDLLVSVEQEISQINEYAKDGYFLAINEYLDYAPNLKNFLEEHPEYEAMCTSDDGNIYGLVGYNDNLIGIVDRAFINKTWLDNVGMAYPETVDELYEVLKAFKEQDANGNGDPNDEIPLSYPGSAHYLYPILMTAFGMPATNANSDHTLLLNGDSLELAQTTENYREFLKYLNKLYTEGLLDETALTQTGDELKSKVMEDRVGVFPGAAPYVLLGSDISVDQGYYALTGLKSDFNTEGSMAVPTAVTSQAKVVINAETEYPEAIVRLIDYLFTDEGRALAQYGTEKSFDMVPVPFDEDYLRYQTKIPEGEEADYGSAEEYRYKKAIINEGLQLYACVDGKYQFLADAKAEDITEEVVEAYGWAALLAERKEAVGLVDVLPALVYTADEADARSNLTTDIENYIEQTKAQFISGELDPEADWDNYLQTLEQMGLSDLMEIEQGAYDRVYGK